MSKALFFILTTFTVFNASALIYGPTDDRQEIWASPRAKKIAASTATMVSRNFILPQTPKDTFNLDFISADISYGLGLCAEERFSKQPYGWLNCSGFLVGDDLLVTAGHCVMFSHGGGQGIIENNVPVSAMCNTFAWVFDFNQGASGAPISITDVSPDRIYNCAKVLYAESLGDAQDPVSGVFSIPQGGQHGKDFAIIQLDRKVVGRAPLKLSSVVPSVGERLLTVGYPSALPAKYAMGMTLPGKYDNYFLTDLDIVEGNSGNVVLNSKDEVTGLVVRGFPYEDYEYIPERKCSKNLVCAKIGEGDCQATLPNEVLGTHVQKASAIVEQLKKMGLAQ